jgi:hypothetical protein
VLPTGSHGYEMRRREIIDHYYDVLPNASERREDPPL